MGDSRFWLPSDRRMFDIDISNDGANGFKYSLMVQSFTANNCLRQTLDTRCILEGQEFTISAKFKYVNRADLVSGMECSPTVLNLKDNRHCPTVRIVGDNCASPVAYTFGMVLITLIGIKIISISMRGLSLLVLNLHRVKLFMQR